MSRRSLARCDGDSKTPDGTRVMSGVKGERQREAVQRCRRKDDEMILRREWCHSIFVPKIQDGGLSLRSLHTQDRFLPSRMCLRQREDICSLPTPRTDLNRLS